MQSVIEGKPTNVAREAELLGKLRDVDLFVRNSGIQAGIFGVLSTPKREKYWPQRSRVLIISRNSSGYEICCPSNSPHKPPKCWQECKRRLFGSETMAKRYEWPFKKEP